VSIEVTALSDFTMSATKKIAPTTAKGILQYLREKRQQFNSPSKDLAQGGLDGIQILTDAGVVDEAGAEAEIYIGGIGAGTVMTIDEIATTIGESEGEVDLMKGGGAEVGRMTDEGRVVNVVIMVQMSNIVSHKCTPST